MTVPISILLVLALFASVYLYGKWRTLQRAEFIRTFRWPRGLPNGWKSITPAFSARTVRWSRGGCGNSSSPTS